MIGKIERVALREVWKHEALDFTRWLEENIDVLNEAIDLSLTTAEREQPAGDFNVDLVAEDEAGNPVVIESQLEKSDHNHLGKVLTYLAAVGAKRAVWIVADPRAEHVGAISWLNESSSGHFYLLKVEAIKIGQSPAAPLLTLIVGPSEESKVVGETKKDLAERHLLRHRFWTALLDAAKVKTKLHTGVGPSHYNWVGTSAGRRGLNYNYVVRKHEADAELYIDFGKDRDEENKAVFDTLAQSREHINVEFGEPLEWQRLEGKRACRIRRKITLGGYRDEQKWPQIHAEMVDAMVRLERVLRPHIAKLKV